MGARRMTADVTERLRCVSVRPVVVDLPPKPAASLVDAPGLGAGDRFCDRFEGMATDRAQASSRAPGILAPPHVPESIGGSTCSSVVNEAASAARTALLHENA